MTKQAIISIVFLIGVISTLVYLLVPVKYRYEGKEYWEYHTGKVCVYVEGSYEFQGCFDHVAVPYKNGVRR